MGRYSFYLKWRCMLRTYQQWFQVLCNDFEENREISTDKEPAQDLQF